MNFFNWIRDGVRSAVLLGVSDAVNDIGTPAQGEDIGRRLLEQARATPTALINGIAGQSGSYAAQKTRPLAGADTSRRVQSGIMQSGVWQRLP